MIVGKVVGSVVSTRKCEKLIGNKFMIIEPVHHMKGDLSQLVAIDMIGAGVGGNGGSENQSRRFKWACQIVCSTTAFFLLPSSGRVLFNI